MRIDKFLLCVSAAVAVLAACSKNDDNDENLPYVGGNLYFVNEIPDFVEYGYEQDLRVAGAFHPDVHARADGSIPDSLGYVFTNPFHVKSDTVKKFTDPVDTKVVYHFKVEKDTLASYAISAFAYAPDHYSISCSSYFTIVRPGFGEKSSIRGFDTTTGSVTLSGKEYYSMQHGGLEWIRQNYADESAGYAYKGSEIMTDIFGRYYTWDEAVSICPDGWRLPTSAELDALVEDFGGVKDIMSDVYFNGDRPKDKMWRYWPKVGTITDGSKLSLFPTGYAVKAGDRYNFYDLQVKSVLWTSDNDGNGKAVARYIHEDQNILYSGLFDQSSFAASVRCVRDLPTSGQ